MKKIMICFIVVIFSFTSCEGAVSSEINDIDNKKEDTQASSTKIIEEDKYFKVKEDEKKNYYISVFSEDGEEVYRKQLQGKEPKLSMINNEIVKIFIQAGTGIESSWCLYYHSKRDSFSKTYYAVQDEKGENILYFDPLKKRIVIRNSFDKQVLYKEVEDELFLKESFVKDLINIQFTNKDDCIIITYWKDGIETHLQKSIA